MVFNQWVPTPKARLSGQLMEVMRQGIATNGLPTIDYDFPLVAAQAECSVRHMLCPTLSRRWHAIFHAAAS
jgi:hypothetical protein